MVAERLLPYAEKYKIKMGYELHVLMMIKSAKTQEMLRQIKRLSSEHLGLIPDAGIFARSISQRHLQEGRDAGVPALILDRAVELWAAKTAMEPTLAELTALGADQPAFNWAGIIWDTFGFSDPEALGGIMPYIVHFHGKFFGIENGDEPDLRYEEIVHALLKYGYQGWLSSEYEGNAPDSFAVVQAHQAMIKHYIASYK